MPFQELTPADPTPEPFRFRAWHGLVVVGVLTVAVPGVVLLARRPPAPPSPSQSGHYSAALDTALGGGASEGMLALSSDEAPSLAVYTVPVGVDITLDGEPAGETPFRATALERRPYRVSLRADGYLPIDTVMHLESYPRALLAVDLTPDGSRPIPDPNAPLPAAEPAAPAPAAAPVDDRPGELMVTVSPWGSIYIDGQLRARETDVRQSFSLPPGSHRVTAEHPDLGRREAVVQVRPGQSTSITLEL